MVIKKTSEIDCTLRGRLLHQPVVLAGSTVHCVVELREERQHVQSTRGWSITGLVGWVIGQFKLDQAALLKQKLASPSGLTFDQAETPDANNLWFDCKSLFTRTVGTDALVFYCEPLKIQSDSIPEDMDSTMAIQLSASISDQLPPSVRGRLFKAAYKLLICIQLTPAVTHSNVRTEALQLPIRVLPAPVMYHSLRAPDGSEAQKLTASHNAAVDRSTDVAGPDQLTRSDLASNPFWSDDREVEQATGNLIGWPGCLMDQLVLGSDSPTVPVQAPTTRNRYPSEPLVNAGRLRSALSRATQHRTSVLDSQQRAQRFDPFGSNDRSDLASEQSALGFSRSSSATQPATFIISCAQGVVGRLCLLRTLFRIEDVLRGYFDFTDAQVLCLGCHLSLQYEERYLDPQDALSDPAILVIGPAPPANTLFTSLPLNEKGEPQAFASQLKSDNTRVTTWADLHLACLSKQLLPFTLPIPINATPQFCVQHPSLLIDGRWRLRLEFILAPNATWPTLGMKSTDSGISESSMQEVWNLPNYLKTEKLAWHLPIQLVSSDPLLICMPQLTSTPTVRISVS